MLPVEVYFSQPQSFINFSRGHYFLKIIHAVRYLFRDFTYGSACKERAVSLKISRSQFFVASVSTWIVPGGEGARGSGTPSFKIKRRKPPYFIWQGSRYDIFTVPLNKELTIWQNFYVELWIATRQKRGKHYSSYDISKQANIPAQNQANKQ